MILFEVIEHHSGTDAVQISKQYYEIRYVFDRLKRTACGWEVLVNGKYESKYRF